MNKEKDSMNIDVEPGTKIIFAFPNAGPTHHQDHAKKYLKINEMYSVEAINVGRFSSIVYLQEIPGVAFSVVLFSEV